jgi:hypothetical protein
MRPTFKKTEHILTGEGEFFDPNWMDSNKPIWPPYQEWDYQREMRIEDVYLWEQICEPWHIGVYAAYDPYAEFYVIRKEINYNFSGWKPPDEARTFEFEVFYGPGSQKQVYKRMQELGVNWQLTDVWVDDNKLWLYQ